MARPAIALERLSGGGGLVVCELKLWIGAVNSRQTRAGAGASCIAERASMRRLSERLAGELEVVRGLRQVARRHRSQRSRLDRYRAEIESLAHAGASSYDIVLWLRKFKRIRVHPTTVWRALRRWRGA